MPKGRPREVLRNEPPFNGKADSKSIYGEPAPDLIQRLTLKDSLDYQVGAHLEDHDEGILVARHP